MAITAMTLDGRTKRTIDFYEKNNIYIGIGRTTAWDSDPTPNDVSVSAEEVEEIQAIKKIDLKKYVRSQEFGEIIFNGSSWTEVSEIEQTSGEIDTISFVAPDTILDSANSLPEFKVGTKFKIIGPTNSGYFTVVTSTISAITVEESITDQGEGADYTIKSNIMTNDIHYLYYEAALDYENGTPDTLPLITYRQIGLLEGPIDDTETPCTGSVYTSLSATEEYPQGILHYIDNRPPVTRTLSQKESIQLIIEF